MAITPLDADLNIIAALDDEPNDVDGLTPEALKAKFDEAGNTVRSYLNDTLIPQLDGNHLPLIYGLEGGQTVRQAINQATLGTVPDGSVTVAKLSEELQKTLDSAFQPWTLVETYSQAGTYAWTVPDIRGDGLPYEIGVYEIGGGGSGAAARSYGTSSSNRSAASGGGSGHARAFTVIVTPGDTVSVVVGAGGAAAVHVGFYSDVDGNGGGTTSFSGITVQGGNGGNGDGQNASAVARGVDGGQGSNFAYGNGMRETAPAMGIALLPWNTSTFPGATSPLECLNPFNGKRYLAAGGGAYTYASSSANTALKEAAVTLDDGTVTGAAAVYSGSTAQNVTAPGAAGYGNGGGGAAASVYESSGISTTTTSGAGSDGAVLIYARGVSA